MKIASHTKFDLERGQTMEFERMRFPSGDSRIPVIVSPWPASVNVDSAFRKSQALMTFSIPAVYTCEQASPSTTALFRFAQGICKSEDPRNGAPTTFNGEHHLHVTKHANCPQ